jgi:hypothetical protein
MNRFKKKVAANGLRLLCIDGASADGISAGVLLRSGSGTGL